MKDNTIDARVLTGNAEIRNAVKDLVKSSAREIVIIVAFVGSGASKYILPSNAKRRPQSIRLICWDKEGCTSPEEIQYLQNQRVHVEFASNLHTKLYWAKGERAVLGSANLSDNGLGHAGLHELAVSIPASSVDIDTLIKQVKPKLVNPDRLDDLFKRTASFRSRHGGKDLFESSRKGGNQKGRKPRTFGEWLSAGALPKWKLFAWDVPFEEDPRPLKDFDPEDYWSGPEWYTRESDWVLFIDLKAPDPESRMAWGMADRQIPMKKKGDDNYNPQDWETHYAVQFESTPDSHVPFKLDRKFKEALDRFLEQENIRTFQDCVKYTEKNDGSLSKERLRKLAKIYK